jgi:cell division protein FtsB
MTHRSGESFGLIEALTKRDNWRCEISETENKRLRNESHSLKHEVSVLSNGSGMNSLNSTCNEELVSMLKDSHEMIKRQNKKLESELDKIKQKYENDLSQMRSSQAQLKSLILKNSF